MQIFLLSRTQLLITFLFALLNVFLFFIANSNFADPSLLHPTFDNAPDGHRYWGVAQILAEGFGFHYRMDTTGELMPLTRGGALPPLLFYLPIKILGLNGAASWIVSIQCVLLYCIALISRALARPFKTSPTLIQILCLFNPILIIAAHHAQSEIIYTFFLASFLRVSIYFFSERPSDYSYWVLLGFLAGCAYLARPVSIFYFALIPILFLALHRIGYKTSRGYACSSSIAGVGIFLLVGILTMSPWLIRNASLENNQNWILPNTITSLNDNFIDLLNFGVIQNGNRYYDNIPPGLAFSIVSAQLDKIDSDATNCLSPTKNEINPDVLKGVGFWKANSRCTKLIRKALILAILDQSIISWVQAGSRAFAMTLFAGGGSNLVAYLGLNRNHREAFTRQPGEKETTAISLILKFLGLPIDAFKNFTSSLIYFISLAAAVATHLLSLAGIFLHCKSHCWDKKNLFLLSTLLIAMFSFGFIGNARLRGPLEPILMLYASIALSHFVIRRNTTNT